MHYFVSSKVLTDKLFTFLCTQESFTWIRLVWGCRCSLSGWTPHTSGHLVTGIWFISIAGFFWQAGWGSCSYVDCLPMLFIAWDQIDAHLNVFSFFIFVWVLILSLLRKAVFLDRGTCVPLSFSSFRCTYLFELLHNFYPWKFYRPILHDFRQFETLSNTKITALEQWSFTFLDIVNRHI